MHRISQTVHGPSCHLSYSTFIRYPFPTCHTLKAISTIRPPQHSTAIIIMPRVRSDKSVLRHRPRPTSVDLANPSGNNIQHYILTSSDAAEGPTNGTSIGERREAPTQQRRSNRHRTPSQSQNGHTRRQLSEQGRLDTAVVRRVGACESYRLKKTKVSPVVDH